MATDTERLCIACQRRPLPKDGSRQRCVPCQTNHDQEARDAEQDKADRRSKAKLTDPLNRWRYQRFYLWKKHLVGYTCGVNDEGRRFAPTGFFYLEAQVSDEKANKLGRRLVDMGLFQPGLDKGWVKRFKAMVLAAERPAAGQRLDWDGSL